MTRQRIGRGWLAANPSAIPAVLKVQRMPLIQLRIKTLVSWRSVRIDDLDGGRSVSQSGR
jgi:hypothetical protein